MGSHKLLQYCFDIFCVGLPHYVPHYNLQKWVHNAPIHFKSCHHPCVLNYKHVYFKNINCLVDRFHWWGDLRCSGTCIIVAISLYIPLYKLINKPLLGCRGSRDTSRKPENFMYHEQVFSQSTELAKQARCCDCKFVCTYFSTNLVSIGC